MTKLAIIGLGYVGLSVAASFVETGREIVGFDIDECRIGEIRNGVDATGQLGPAILKRLANVVTADPSALADCRTWIIIVQTGLTADKMPDTSAVARAATLVAPMIRPGDLVVLSSTVPIGFTEGKLRPILEKISGLVASEDFDLAYAPERFDPGNTTYTLNTITKIISGINAQARARTRELYRPVVKEMFEAASIKAAEASRLFENVQRDINIAFLNDAVRILKGWEIDTSDVLAIAQTKWNWLPFQPGLTGGHCIPVQTHYLKQSGLEVGVSPALTTLVRDINEDMPPRIVDVCMERLSQRGVTGAPTVTVMGVAYKENVADVRGSAVIPLVRALLARGCTVQMIDPLVRDVDLQAVHGLSLTPPAVQRPGDAVLVAVAHRQFIESGWDAVLPHLSKDAGLVIDLRRILPREAVPVGVDLWRL